MEANAVWGVVMVAYVLTALPLLGVDPRPKNPVPGSESLRRWEARDRRQTRLLGLWSAGLFLILGAWWLFGPDSG